MLISYIKKLKLIITSLFSVLILQSCLIEESKRNEEIDSSSGFCDQVQTGTVNWQALLTEDCKKLEQFGLFQESSEPRYSPNEGGYYYQPTSELFSDYAKKTRHMFVPLGTNIRYMQNDVLEFPLGSVLTKAFYLPTPNGFLPIEVRLLILRETGWTPLVYIFDESENGFYLHKTGSVIETEIWLEQSDQSLEVDYLVPDVLQCKTCHENNDGVTSRFTPISPKARLLNWALDGSEITQLEELAEQGIIIDLPQSDLEFMPSWEDENYSLEQRAKSYLDINCSHCHSDTGSAGLSGLRLEYWRDVGYQHGVCNEVHGWNGGPLGLTYDIVPGSAVESALVYRMGVVKDAKAMMPPLGRSVSHQKAIEVVSQWIDNMTHAISCE